MAFFSDSESHPRRTADGKPYISAETQEMLKTLSVQLVVFEQLFQEQWFVSNICIIFIISRAGAVFVFLSRAAVFNLTTRGSKIETGPNEEAADDFGSDSENTNFCDQVLVILSNDDVRCQTLNPR